MPTDIDTPRPFNPLDYANLTKNVVDELMRQPPSTLPIPRRFVGAGVYALFYVGKLPAYAKATSADATSPIYVGKAVPRGARKGVIDEVYVGAQLYDRLSEHADSIRAGADLSHGDFLCRYLVVEPLWIVMAEQFLITRFKPLWNLVLDGFGNHDPGSGRHRGEISWWDAMHPGRHWAQRLRQTRTREDAVRRVYEFYAALQTKPQLVEDVAETIAREEAESDE